MCLLTIYVLTFEAPEKLARLLDSLLPFTSTRTQIIVGDNSVVNDAAQVVAERRTIFNDQIVYVRHRCNIGLGNLLRGFELAESKYFWMVGCGDRFLPGALEIVEPILEESDEAFIMFRINGVKGGAWPANERVYDYFPDAMRDLEKGPLTNINSVIYNLDKIRDFIPAGYEAMSSLMPHTGMIAAALDRSGSHRLVYHPVQVFERLPRPQSWDPRIVWSNLSLIYPRPENEREWNKVRREILKTHSPWLPAVLWRMKLPLTRGFLLKTYGQFGLASLPLLVRLMIVPLEQRSSRLHSFAANIQRLYNSVKYRISLGIKAVGSRHWAVSSKYKAVDRKREIDGRR